jgi:hypothetical protein
MQSYFCVIMFIFANSYTYSSSVLPNSGLVTTSDLTNRTLRPPKNSLKPYDDFTKTNNSLRKRARKFKRQNKNTIINNNNITLNVYQYKINYMTLRPMTSESNMESQKDPDTAEINCVQPTSTSTSRLTSGLALQTTLRLTMTLSGINKMLVSSCKHSRKKSCHPNDRLESCEEFTAVYRLLFKVKIHYFLWKFFQKICQYSKNMNLRIHFQIQDSTPRKEVINEFQNHREKLSKIQSLGLPSCSTYFSAFFKHDIFLLNYHEADFILVFHPPRTCPTTPSKGQPLSYD